VDLNILWDVIQEDLPPLIEKLEQILEGMPDGPVWEPVPNPIKWEVPKGEAFARVESARGELGYYVVSNGTEKPYRVYVRGPSISHGVLVLEEILKGQRLADISPILFSLDICAPSIDR
jgi:NADH-quinone oxidoreductase subunit D